VFAIDLETCPECGGQLRVAAFAHPCARGISASMHVIACIEDPQWIRKILGQPVETRPGRRRELTKAAQAKF
jgi:hypothetical protein